MLLRRCLCLMLLCAVICCTLFSFSAYAVEDKYLFGDASRPYPVAGYDSATDTYYRLEDYIADGFQVFVFACGYPIMYITNQPVSFELLDDGRETVLVSGYSFYYFSGGDYWVFDGFTSEYESFDIDSTLCRLRWCSHDLYRDEELIMEGDTYFHRCDGTDCPSSDLNKDNYCDACGFRFAVLRDYSPVTVPQLMSNAGQILTSAVSWVGNVGSTILQQPLLLAFTALPLCGLGIAVFRRLKNTV